MACTLLATYPEVFAGGAIVAGMPYKSAYGRMDALSAMVHGRVRPTLVWSGLVRATSSYRGKLAAHLRLARHGGQDGQPR